MDQKKVGIFIKQLRKEKNMTQEELADLLRISHKTVSKWECGRGCPDIGILKELASILGVSVNDLLEGKRINENDHPDTLVNSLSFYNRRLKHRLLIGLLAVLLLFTPFIVLGIGEMGIVKWMPSYTTVAMKHTTKQLLLALQEYDYDQLEALLGSNGNVDIGIEKQEHYTSQEIIRRLHDLEDSGVRFQNFSFDQSSYGTMVGFSVDIVYKGVNYLDGYCIMRKNAPFSNFSFIMFLPDHDFEKEIASKIENVFFPGSEFFTL